MLAAMDVLPVIAGVSLVAAAAFLLVIVWWRSRRRMLPVAVRAKFRREWERAAAQSDPVRRVVEAEKLLAALLGALGFRGTFAEKLRRAGPRLPACDDVWDAHRLRNRLAHEVGVTVSDREAERAVRAFGRAVDALL